MQWLVPPLKKKFEDSTITYHVAVDTFIIPNLPKAQHRYTVKCLIYQEHNPVRVPILCAIINSK